MGRGYQYRQRSNEALSDNEARRNNETTRGKKVPKRAKEQQSTMQLVLCCSFGLLGNNAQKKSSKVTRVMKQQKQQ
jgi:hypothetical protein